nr:putative nucleotidyltransferase, ribonuclease H [Tanacetum cinerariifolium]
ERTIQTLEDMLHSCALEWTGNWDDYICLVEFAYNSSWHASIKCAPFEMLYGWKCRASNCWDQVGERVIEGPEMIEVTNEKVAIAKEKLKEARTRQKSYADKHRRSIEFLPCDSVFLKDYDASSAMLCLFIHAIYVMYCPYIRSLSVVLSRIFFSCLIQQMVNTRIDADLPAAVQNALQTLLPQICVEIRKEFHTSSGPSDAGGNPPPVTIHTWLEHFNKQKPHSFEKATAPVDAENWISHMEKIFDTNTETSTEFMQRFLRLAGFLEAAVGTEEEQAKNFQWGLRRSTLNHLMCMSYTDVAQVANAARNYEILCERDDDDTERPDKRQKSENRLDIRKCNGRIPRGLKPKEETFKVALDALALTPFYPAFVITADVPEVYMHQFWNSVYKHHDFYRFKIDKKKRFKLTPQIKESKAYKTYHGYATGTVPPKVASKFKKAYPSKKDSVVVPADEEPVQKVEKKRKVDVARGKGIDLLSEVALTKEAQMKEVIKKSLRDFHKSHPSGSGSVTKKPPSVEKITPPVTNKGTGSEQENDSEEHESDSEQDTNESESDSKSNQQDDNDDEVKDDDNDDDQFEGDEERRMDSDDVPDKKADVGMTDA